jgi:hypothetical protein
MALDFTTGVLDPRVTFTRASTGTFVGSNGLIQTAAINGPRFDYNPTTLAPKGLLIEEARTNLAQQSADFTTLFWTKTNVNLTTGIDDPAGGTSATTLTATAASGSIQQPVVGGVASTTYSASFWIRRRTGTGQISLRCGDLTAIPITVTSSWVRYVVTAVASTVTVRLAVILTTSGDAVDVWGAQIEAGAFATSYIPTLASQVTRNPDIATMTGTNFSSWFNANEGTFVATTSVLNLAANRPIMQTATAGLSNGSQYVYYNPASSRFGYRVYDAAGTAVGAVNYTNAGTPVINTPYCAAIGYKTDSFAISVNGAAVGLDTLGTVSGTADTLLIGSDTSITYLNGHAKSLRFYPLRLTNAETQAFSKG